MYLVFMYTMNGFQTLSIIGVIFSIFCQVILYIIGKKVENMWALYPSWVAVFILGSLIRYFDKGDDHHH